MLREVLFLTTLVAFTAGIFAPAPAQDPNSSQKELKTGGYQVVDHPKGEMFEFALSKVLSQHK